VEQISITENDGYIYVVHFGIKDAIFSFLLHVFPLYATLEMKMTNYQPIEAGQSPLGSSLSFFPPFSL